MKEKFFDDLLWLELPDTFIDVSNKDRELKFPFPIPPEIIREEQISSVTFTLSILDESLESQNVGRAVKAMCRVMEHMYPQSVVWNATIELQDFVLGWFTYKNDEINNVENFHITFILPVFSKFVMGGFHGPIEAKKDMFRVFNETIKSMECHKKERILQWWEGVNPID